MRRTDAKTIIVYYGEIPGMIKLMNRERQELEDEYYSLHGVSSDGLTRGTTPGNPVENQVILAEEKGAAARLREIAERVEELEADRRIIQRAVDSLSGRYKSLLVMRYLYGYSWTKISMRIAQPDSTVRHWNDKALERVGMVLDGEEKIREILKRASCARV